MLFACLIWAFGLQTATPVELGQYVNKPDTSFAWERQVVDSYESLAITSQTWQGAAWKHDIVIVRPSQPAVLGAAIIEITGWEPNQRDYEYARTLAEASGLPVALLFQIPNQPIDGREEDDLIAHTFEQFFMTGDPSWPLLFPMVKSVIRTMDALQQSTEGSADPLTKFVLTGASKRGWTAWLAGAVDDDRIVGIAPGIFDNLDFVAQLKQQMEYWDEYSPMISDYTDRGLQDLLETEPGQKLIRIVDPISYLPRMTVPTMVLTATNDPFWTVDSTQVYWDRLHMPKWSVVNPNTGHGAGDVDWWAPSLGEFARRCAEGRTLPVFAPESVLTPSGWEIKIRAGAGAEEYRVWRAGSDDLHFEEAEWSAGETSYLMAVEQEFEIVVKGDRARGANMAIFVEVMFGREGRRFRLTTPVYLVRAR